MQVTLDLPDDAFAKANAVAKEQSRSLGSVIADFIRGGRKSYQRQSLVSSPSKEQWKLPVSKGARQVTEAEINRMLEEDGLL